MASRDFHVVPREVPPELQARLVAGAVAVLVGFALLAARLWLLQVVHGWKEETPRRVKELQYEARAHLPPLFYPMIERIGAGLVGLAVVCLVLPLVAAPAAAKGTTIHVPDDKPTIQAAVDAAQPGTLILVAPGVYKEGVTVQPKHHDIVIRGEDRERTIVDGEFSGDKAKTNGFTVLADGVAIEAYFESPLGRLFAKGPIHATLDDTEQRLRPFTITYPVILSGADRSARGLIAAVEGPCV